MVTVVSVHWLACMRSCASALQLPELETESVSVGQPAGQTDLTDQFLRPVGRAHHQHALLARHIGPIHLNQEFSLDSATGFELAILALGQKGVDLVLKQKKNSAQGQFSARSR